ncbi:MAG: tRNA pseudouridine(38-40) synthase TruA [Bacillota bacterium]
MKQRYVGQLMFKGTKFQGWQTQKQGQSVQEHVEKTFSQILNQPVPVHGASRTDAGVHARGFVFHMDVITTMTTSKMVYAFNRIIDADIYLVSLKKVLSSFEARYQHSRKTYRYQILLGERNPFLQDTVMHIPHTLSLTKIRQGMRYFLGQHDFRNFTTKKEDGANFVRRIFQFKLKQAGPLLTFTIIGDGFMTYMVRMIIGALIALGEGKINLETIQDYLDNKIKGPVSYKAEPQGLCLEKVRYEK